MRTGIGSYGGIVVKRKIAFVLVAAFCLSLFAGCSKPEQNQFAEHNVTQKPEENVIMDKNNTQSIPNHDGSLYDISVDDHDADSTYNENGTKIELADGDIRISGAGASAQGNIVTISAGGTYIISGSLSDGQIIVEDKGKSDIHLVLNNIDITCSNSSALFIKQSGETKITITGENRLADVGEYILNDEEEPTAVLFSKDDLVINGEGNLTVEANYNDGITSKDDLKIISADITINAVDDAIVGKDSLAVKDVNFTINAGGHGLKSSNDSNGQKGIIHIESGSFDIDTTGDCFHAATAIQVIDGSFNLISEDDAFHSDASVMIEGGNINVKSCYEGIEGRDVFINGGVIYITSDDDAINAASDVSAQTGGAEKVGFGGKGFMMGETGNTLTINGGYICIRASGDGIDINGASYIKGGTIIVNGPVSGADGSLDYSQEFVVTGGTLITAGSAQMAQVPSDNSTVYTVAGRYDGESGTVIHIEDESGADIVTFAPCVDFSFFTVTSPEFAKEGKYYYNIGGSAEGDSLDGLYTSPNYTPDDEMTEFVITDTVTYIGEGGASGFMNGFGNKGFGKGERQPGEAPQLPQGERPQKPQAGKPFEKTE